MSNSRAALGRIEAARRYTIDLLEPVPPDDWFRMPGEGVTHIAWQVGHLAFAEYRLALQRIRGKRPEDDRLFPTSYFELFAARSTPKADAGVYPSVEEIRSVFDGVHRQVQTELAGVEDAALESATSAAHPQFTTRLGALEWCARHEMLHAGQIGLLRRLLGSPPTW